MVMDQQQQYQQLQQPLRSPHKCQLQEQQRFYPQQQYTAEYTGITETKL